MVKALSVVLCVLSVFGCIFMQQPKDISVATMTVAEGNPATVVTEVTEVSKPNKTMTVVATAYCPCSKCCGEYANGITASGAIARANHTIAVDRNVIPLGTKVLYNGNIYVAEDTGGAVKGNRIDIYFDSHNEALRFGRKTIEIEVIV